MNFVEIKSFPEWALNYAVLGKDSSLKESEIQELKTHWSSLSML